MDGVPVANPPPSPPLLRLPPTHSHPMWHAWDMAAEMCLMQLPTLLSDPGADFQPSPFFSEQLTAFELWLQVGPACSLYCALYCSLY